MQGWRKKKRPKAARALLRVEEAEEAGRLDPRTGFVGAMVIAVAALGLYFGVGKPGLPDQPYAMRLKGWVAALNTVPQTLEARPAAAAMLQMAGQYGDQPGYWMHLGETHVVAWRLLSGGRRLQARGAAGA